MDSSFSYFDNLQLDALLEWNWKCGIGHRDIYVHYWLYMLGIIALGDNGIETAMGIHAWNNLYVALIFNSADSGYQMCHPWSHQPTDPFAGIPFMVVMALLTINPVLESKKTI